MRRALGCAALALLVLPALVAGGLPPASLPADPGGLCALASSSAPLRCGPAALPLWSTQDGGPAGASLGGMAALVAADGQRVLVLSFEAGSDSAFLSALDAATGLVQWRAYLDDGTAGDVCNAKGLSAGPDAGLAYVAATCYDPSAVDASVHGVVLAVRPGDGSVAWRAQDTGITSIDQLVADPGGQRLWVIGPEQPVAFGPVGIAAVDGTGATVRRMTLPEPDLSYWATLAVSPDGQRVVAAGSTLDLSDPANVAGDTWVSTFDAERGTLLWQAAFHQPGMAGRTFPASIAVAGGAVVLSTQTDAANASASALAAFDAGSGALRWTVADGARAFRWTMVAADLAVVQAFPRVGDGEVRAFDLGTGAPRWVARTDGCWCGSATPWVLDADAGTLYVMGTARTASVEGHEVAAYGVCAVAVADGGTSWCRRAFQHDTTAGGELQSRALALSPDGTRLFATGESVERDVLDPASAAGDVLALRDPALPHTATGTAAFALGLPWPAGLVPDVGVADLVPGLV